MFVWSLEQRNKMDNNNSFIPEDPDEGETLF